MDSPLYADVLVVKQGSSADYTFQYMIPKRLLGLLEFGSWVQVPFGSYKTTGFVLGFSSVPVMAELKEIIALLQEEPLFNKEQLELAQWLADYYFCTTIKALLSVIAPALKKTNPRAVERLYSLIQPQELPGLREQMTRCPKKLAVLETALKHPGLNKKELAACAGVSVKTVRQLCAEGLLRVETHFPDRDPYEHYSSVSKEAVSLTEEQRHVVKEINDVLQEGSHRVFMLRGVTGSGKTEVYLRCIERAMDLGKQAITLVPEIALTPQMVRLYKERFGNKVAVLHSHMSDGERYDQWHRIARAEAPIVLGVRSAVMAPAPNVGLIIVDEEHEPSYKQERAPRYHARTVALYRTRKNNGVLVLGSATPSLESYCRALPGGEYALLDMPQRVNSKKMPQVQLVDMRQEMQAGNSGVFSLILLSKLRQRLLRKEQAIVFLNRRGYKTLVICRECGLVLKCPRCDISLIYHKDGYLRCHYCNYQIQAPKACPACGSQHLNYFGTGTQRVELELASALPGARILRMDADTTRRKRSHEKILNAYAKGEADILVGTQMVAKGLDLPGVTLVGVVNADSTLHMPDFRAGERTFQLLAQVAGRTGRGAKPGEVLIQTYTPEHYAVQTAAHHDYQDFFNRELTLRRTMNYPPFSKMIRLLISGKDNQTVQQKAAQIRFSLDALKQELEAKGVTIVGPAPAPISRLKEHYRWHIILWSADYPQLRRLMEQYFKSGYIKLGKGLEMSIDVDPMYNT